MPFQVAWNRGARDGRTLVKCNEPGVCPRSCGPDGASDSSSGAASGSRAGCARSVPTASLLALVAVAAVPPATAPASAAHPPSASVAAPPLPVAPSPAVADTAVAALPVPPARPAPAPSPVPLPAADTVLWLMPQLREPHRSLLSQPPPPVPFARIGTARIPATRLPGGAEPLGPGPRYPPYLAPLVQPADSTALALSPLGRPDWRRNPLLRIGALGRTLGPADIPPPGSPRSPARRAPETSRFRTEYADLGFSLRGSGQLGGDWTRFRPCDETVQVTCEVSLLPRLRPDIQFAATADGTIADRVLVDVDYDQTRAFSGANRFNIHYQGRPGEFLQRLEVGDVRFDLPPSRFLREGVPAGNFGFQAAFEAGPVTVQSVWAQQGGEITSRTFRLDGPGRGFARTDTLVLDDADYVDGQFFFLFDPAAFYAHPHLDVLSLSPSDAPAAVVPGPDPIQLYRSEIDLYAQQQVEGYIQADATAGEGEHAVTESAWFRYLRPGADYLVHPSGLWVALRTPLGPDEMLAVTYVAASGDTVGTYDPERIHRAGGRPRLRLLKASAAQHQPGRPTWRTEMHQVYRVSSSNDVDPGSVELVVSLGEASGGRTFARRPNGDDVTWLRFFGLDDEVPRDRLDPSHVYRPGLESLEDLPPVPGAFVIFPTLAPFAEPPPLRGLSLGAEEARRILGANRNQAIYRDPDPFERENGGVFRLNLSYEVRGAGPASSFALGAVGIREGTERVTLGDQVLVRDMDYLIDYDVGQLVLVNPDRLLAAHSDRVLQASWEQRSFFQVAPTSVLGLDARYELGEYGAVNLTGLYQAEDELVRRPQLGLEAGAVGLGSLNGVANFDAPVLARLLDAVPGLDPGDGAVVRLSGETAVSLPNPSVQGQVYVDDFDGQSARSLSLRDQDWRRGSRPASRDGAEQVLPPEMSPASLAALAWQHTWIDESAAGDSLGVFQGFNPSADIDQQIRITGSAVREPGLHVRFQPASGDRSGPGAWASITTVLSPTGSDLTKSDFVEFYVRDGDFLNLVLDVGVVSEDAFFADSTGAVNGVKPGSGVPWGLGTLDQEADPRRGEVWGNVADGRGVWDEDCFAERARVYRLGDPNANCTRGNGRPDSEDLDEDGNLDSLERYRRFVVPLDGSSPFLVRDRDETGTRFRLYRVPLRDPSGLDVGGTIGEAELRAVRHLRFTVTGRRRDSFVLARLGIVGSTWLKRYPGGVLTGLAGDTAALGGRVEVGPVSKLTADDAYVSPPGVVEQLDDPAAAFGGQGIEFNERSLALSFEDVPPGARVEVYNRFPQRPRDFLSYREARLWVAPVRGETGPNVAAWFFLKVGTDDRNFYLYRTRLPPSRAPGPLRQEDWLPEVVVEFEPWLELRRRAEEQLILEPRSARDPPLVLWSADSAYAVVLQDRGRAPNLASVREISLGVANETGGVASGEVWVDELRLARGLRDAGVVSAVDARVEGGEFLDARASYRSRGGFFRQLRGSPSFQNDQSVDLAATLQMGRFAPAGWGLEAPLVVAHQRESRAPVFLNRSDVRADRLAGLRTPGFGRTRLDFALRRRSPEGGGFWNALLGGFDVRAGWVRSSLQDITTESDGDGADLFAGYRAAPPRRDVPLFPGRAGEIVRALLPAFVEDRIAGARLRWTPESLAVETEYLSRDLHTTRFDRIIRTDADSAAVAKEAPRRVLTAVARIALRPVESVTAEADFVSGRDLLASHRLASGADVQALVEAERRRFAGIDWGWEVDRRLRTRLAYRPRLADWIRASVQANTDYVSERNPDLVGRRSGEGRARSDTARALLRNVNGRRDLVAAFALDPGRLAGEGAERGPFARWWSDAMDPLSVTWSRGVASRFDRDPVDPGLLYELGWGGRERFMRIGADTAATLGERDRVQVRGGLRLPGSASVGLAYDRSLNETLDTRSDREVLRQVWPDVRAEIANLILPGWLSAAVERVSAGTGYRKERRALAFGAVARQDRTREDREVPMSLSLGFPRGFALTYRGRLGRGESSDPTGDTRRRANSHAFALSARLASPLAAFSRRGAPLRIVLDVGYTDEVQCRVAGVGIEGAAACVSFIDQLERAASVSVDSQVRDFQLGVRLRYLDRRSFVGRRAGTTQLQMNVFGHFLLTAGLIPGAS